MFDILAERLRQGRRTVAFPDSLPPLPPRFRGLPELAATPCAAGCQFGCVAVCPTGALGADADGLFLDLGRCILCGGCEGACPAGRVTFTRNHRLASSTRQGLILRPGTKPEVTPLDPARRRLFARSLKLRQISAGGCNACEADTNVLGTIVFDLGRFGIDFVASPRHADGVAVTGPVTPRNPWRRSGRTQRGGPVHSGLSAPPPDHPRRPAASARTPHALTAPRVSVRLAIPGRSWEIHARSPMPGPRRLSCAHASLPCPQRR